MKPNPIRIALPAVLTLFAGLATAQDGLQAHGPLNEFGFPAYYEDYNGLRLLQCIDQDDPFCGIPPEEALVGPLVVGPDPALNNFFGESFYWLAIANLTVPGRGDALLVMAIEAVFGNPTEAIVDGDQTVFSRLRIRLQGDNFEGGLYRVDTPYGTFDFDAAPVEPGTRIVNFTTDCLHVIQPAPAPMFLCGSAPDGPGGNYFTTPLGVLDDGTPAPEVAPNGPHYLVWDPAVAPAAPAGYAGDPAIPHQVVGAVAPNQNHFRVRFSPTGNFNNPVFDETTDLFSVVGKIEAGGGDPPPPPPPPPVFTLAGPTPGLAGAQNTLSTSNGSPNNRVAFLLGFGAGTTFLAPGPCPAGISLGITGIRLVGLVGSSATGTASRTVGLPPFLGGMTIHFQALDVATCGVSNVVSATL